jgi:hypothetical protein
MPATVFGHALRNLAFQALPLRQRLVRELNEFLFVHPPAWANLLAFWQSARTLSLATLARADCPDGVNLCLNVASLSNVAGAFGSVISSLSLMIARSLGDRSGWSVIMVPIPMDFASFDDDAETLAVRPPPILSRIAEFELLADRTQTSRGPAAIAGGRVNLQHSWIDWMETEGLELQNSARCFSGTFMPPTIVEATLLKSGLFFHKTTDMIPTFLGEIPWELKGTVGSFDVEISFVRGCSASTLASISEWNFADFDSRARALRGLVDRAAALVVGGLHEGPERQRWDDLMRNWKDEQLHKATALLNQLIQFGAVATDTELGRVTLRLYVCTECPAPGVWTADTGQLANEVEDFAGDEASRALREGPFITASLL